MKYLIATRYCALKTVPLATDDKRRSFHEFCDEKHDRVNGDPSDFGVDYSEFYASPKGKRLFIEFRKDWETTDLDRLFDCGAFSQCTLVIIVPDTASVPPDVLKKMDAYKELMSQKPAKRTAALVDFELIEEFRRRAESIRDACSKGNQSLTKKVKTSNPMEPKALKNKADTADSKSENSAEKKTRYRDPEKSRYYNHVRKYLDRARESFEKKFKTLEEIQAINESTVADYLKGLPEFAKKKADTTEKSHYNTLKRGVKHCPAWHAFEKWRDEHLSTPGKGIPHVRETHETWTNPKGKLDGLNVVRRESKSTYRERLEQTKQRTETRRKKSKKCGKDTDKDT